MKTDPQTEQGLDMKCLEVLRSLRIPAFVMKFDEIEKGVGVVKEVTAHFLKAMEFFGGNSEAGHYLGKTHSQLHDDDPAGIYSENDFKAIEQPLEPLRVDEGTAVDVIKVRITREAVKPALVLGFFVYYDEKKAEKRNDTVDPRLKSALEDLSEHVKFTSEVSDSFA